MGALTLSLFGSIAYDIGLGVLVDQAWNDPVVDPFDRDEVTGA